MDDCNYFTTESAGLSTSQALKILFTEIENELDFCKCQCHGFKGFRIWIKESFHHSSISSIFRWPCILLTILTFIIFFINYIFSSEITLLFQSILILLLTAFNVVITGCETRLRHRELHGKCHSISKDIKNCLENISIIKEWETGKYFPNLHLPQSPCITLQWTLRDHKKVNLPAVLLVRGDVIQLCPGHQAPGHCRNIEPIEDNDLGYIELQRGDIFAPSLDHASNNFTNPRLRKAVKPIKFLMLETPYILNLRLALNKSWKRPATLYEKERHIILAKYVEIIIVPLIWTIVFIVSLLHYGYIDSDWSIDFKSELFVNILLRSSLCILPLLPLTLPSTWLLINAYGVAHLFNMLRSESTIKSVSDLDSPSSALGTFIVKSQKDKDSCFEDVESGTPGETIIPFSMSLNQMYNSLFGLIFCKDGNLWRSSNILQVFGSITALCCIDKKGILSWPNPAADKVFFLTSNLKKAADSDIDDFSNDDLNDDNADVQDNDFDHNSISGDLYLKDMRSKKQKYWSKAEVLDITHNMHNNFGLQFDDPEWSRFLPNLKPLGLSILLNTCNVNAQEEYTRFCDHITKESLRNEASVPVINKRCLCELSRLIGFTESALQNYEYLFQVCSFRHVKPEVIQQGKLAKSLNLPRLKMPFPNISSAAIKDVCTNGYQMFSQGTGDLILDSCTEFWDGKDLCLLSDVDRKRILDFYHRSSLTANCMAFAYVPLNIIPDKKVMSEYYIEMPLEKSHLFRSQKSLNSSIKSWDQKDMNRPLLSHHLSNDSLLLKDEKDDDSSNSFESFHFESILNQLSNEVFIGMVTMQYQASSDFVALVEKLDKACVRFVHFSKENELRSRVFSEKMGLESGWNCHISLLSENSNDGQIHPLPSSTRESKLSLINEPHRTSTLLRTQSAPSYVNMETNVVKFDQQETVVGLNNSANEISKINDKSSLSSVSDCSQKESINLMGSTEEIKTKVCANISPSPSRITESTNTDQSAPIAFDISNRAKLPKGIENIRPHLEAVDNVPLLVSLFTDCTPETTREMIDIMQENGEVVCVIGSSANVSNIPIFLQADASIGIEPLYPQICIREPITKAEMIEGEDFLTPIELSNSLNTLPCSISFKREHSISLSRIIMEARHYMLNARNNLQFFFSCSLSLSLAQLFSSLLFLPPLLSPSQVLWLVCVIFPFLSLSLMGTSLDPQVMNIATGKNLNLSKESLIYFVLCYLIKFSPSIMVTVACFAIIVENSCKRIVDDNSHNAHGPCWMFINSNISHTHLDQVWSNHILLSQTFSTFFLVVYFIFISMGFVHRSHLLWQRSPFANSCWIILSVILLILNCIFCLAEIYFYPNESVLTNYYLQSIPVYVYFLACSWPIVLVSINSSIKRHEISVSERQQRRARLEFGTKLGMNSPF